MINLKLKQPFPIKQKEDCWLELINDLKAKNKFLHLIPMMEDRRRVGIETYKTPLGRQNGRNYRQDILEELLDALVYAFAAGEENICKGILLVLAFNFGELPEDPQDIKE